MARPFSLIETLKTRKATKVSEISQVYFKARWKEITEVKF